MAFNDKILLPSSDKFYMIRMQGGKIFTSLNTTFVSSNFDAVSGATFKIFEAYIQKNLTIKDFYVNNNSNFADVVLTRVDTLTTIKTGGVAPYYNTYSYNPETGYIKFSCQQLGANVIQSIEALILEYYIFFTSYTGRRAPLDMISGEEVYWSPRLPKDINIAYSQNNTLNGQLSVSTSNITLKNQDLYFNDFFGDHDSFNNREVKVWRCIDTIANYQLEFSGVVKGANLDDQNCSFDLDDILSVLDSTFYGGHTSYKYYNDMQNGSDYTIKGDDQARPIRRLQGMIGPYDVYYYNTGQDLQVRLLDPEKMMLATCVSYNGTSKTGGTNRFWSCGFGPAACVTTTKTVTSILDRIIGSYQDSRLGISAGGADQVFSVGDTFRLGSQYGIVTDVSDTVIYSWPRNSSFANGTIERCQVPAVVIVANGVKYYPRSFRDYNPYIGTKGDVQIQFTANFEATIGMPTLDPDSHEVYTRFNNDSSYSAKASDIVKGVLTEAGLTCATTFTPDQSPAWPDPKLALCVPFIGEDTFPSCFDVVQKCLISALSFIYFDNEGKLRYKSFLDGIYTSANIENQSGQSPDEQVNQSNSSDFSVQFSLYDQHIGTYFLFSHAPQKNGVFGSNTAAAYKKGGGVPAQRLYRTNKYYEVESVLDVNDITGLFSSDFFNKYNDLMSGRRAEFKLNIFSRHFRLYIGDDILVSRAKIVGGSNSTYMRVISLSKSSNESEIKLLDLKKFPK